MSFDGMQVQIYPDSVDVETLGTEYETPVLQCGNAFERDELEEAYQHAEAKQRISAAAKAQSGACAIFLTVCILWAVSREASSTRHDVSDGDDLGSDSTALLVGVLMITCLLAMSITLFCHVEQCSRICGDAVLSAVLGAICCCTTWTTVTWLIHYQAPAAAASAMHNGMLHIDWEQHNASSSLREEVTFDMVTMFIFIGNNLGLLVDMGMMVIVCIGKTATIAMLALLTCSAHTYAHTCTHTRVDGHIAHVRSSH